MDVLVLAPSDVPTSESATVGPGPLVCPLDLRPRAAAAQAGFLASHGPPLQEAALGESGLSVQAATDRANAVMAQLDGGSVHVISSTWTVPLPWFALVDPRERYLVVGDEAAREVCWRSPMADVRRRAARAHSVAKETMGEEGPAAVLRDTARWLENFHPHSAVELDYGGLVQLLDDEELEADSSAEDVNAIVDAMEDGDPTEVAERYQRLREFWAVLAARERYN